MPITTPSPLKGIKGLRSLPADEQQRFMQANYYKVRDLESSYDRDQAYQNIYMNQQFKKRFGEAAFKKFSNGTQEMADYRNAMLRHKVINEEFDKLYKPTDKNPNYGLGNLYNQYAELPDDDKYSILSSKYLTPAEFEAKWHNDYKANQDARIGKKGAWAMFGALGGSSVPASAHMLQEAQHGEAAKQHSKEQNQKILDNIYNNAADKVAKTFGREVGDAYNSLYGLSDEEIDKQFMKEIRHGSYTDKNGVANLGIPTWEAYFYEKGKKKVQSEVYNLSIDEKREILAKKRAYEANMSPVMARTALENDAKRYVKAHQNGLTRAGLFAKDVLISSMSYTADKANGLAEVGRAIEDGLAHLGVMDKPKVWVDDTGNVVDIKKVKTFKGRNGATAYKGKDGKVHYLNREEVDFTTLHNLGKNEDGSDIKGALSTDWLTLNPQYWNRAEQFGTFDKDLQKQYEEIGVSPYKVAYDPNEESSIWYEAFKMMSFGLADTASMLIPWGIGSLGNTLSNASKLGKVITNIGKVVDVTGKVLSNPYVQGTEGALGIAYAYGRGAFQESLAQNLNKAEDNITNKAKQDIWDKYNSDKKFKATVDAAVSKRAAEMKKRYLAQMQAQEGKQLINNSAIDKQMTAAARQEILQGYIQDAIDNAKSSGRFAELQQHAIDEAGDAAFNSFWPEAIKYGLVNNFGHRKFLYQSPGGVQKKLSSALKGLKETTTSAGRKRLATDASKFLTRKDKWWELTKTAASQAWGGAWTNGTDDMMVDAAERINKDSFDRYLQAYNNGEAMASTYGLMDGLFSYVKGLQNSMGQETTMNSTAVGALGSLVNANINFTNLLSLATAKGRENYRNTVLREIDRDADGQPLKNEDGTVKYKELSKGQKARNIANFFIQNGVLNSYYAKKASEASLQSHADYVNSLLDEYNDFEDVEHLIASNLASDNMQNPGDAKTMRFLRALYAIKALKNLGEKSDDPASISSVVQKAKNLIDRAAELNNENGNNPFSEEEINSLLGQYYAANKGIEQSDINNQKACYEIAQNAQKLKEAASALETADEEIRKAEKLRNEPIAPGVRTSLLINKALKGHWEERNKKMRSEIDDPSTIGSTPSSSEYVASLGGSKNALALDKVYEKQKAEIEEQQVEQKKKVDDLKQKLTAAQEETKSKEEGTAERKQAEQREKEAKTNYDDAVLQYNHLGNLISETEEKQKNLLANNVSEDLYINNERVVKAQSEYNTAKEALAEAKAKKQGWLDENGKVKKGHNKQVEKINKEIVSLEEKLAEKKEILNSSYDRVLTADEIFALEPITRARMMAEENRELYSKEQQREIEKLEDRLLLRDADGLQKIQDIALLTKRIEAAELSYTRMMKNPEAAAVSIEAQRALSASAAYNLVNQRNAEIAAAHINEFSEAVKGYDDINEEDKREYVYRVLRRLNRNILGIIDNQSLLPQYQKEVTDANEWRKTVEDISAIVSQSDKGEAWKNNFMQNIDGIVERSHNKKEIMSALEKVIDDIDNDEATQDFQDLLESMENMGYQRDHAAIESRKERKEREAAEAKAREEQRKKLEAEAKAAAERAKEEAERKAKEEAERKNSYTVNTEAIDNFTPEELREFNSNYTEGAVESMKKNPDYYRNKFKDETQVIADYMNGKESARTTLVKLNYEPSFVEQCSEEELQKYIDEEVERYKRFLTPPENDEFRADHTPTKEGFTGKIEEIDFDLKDEDNSKEEPKSITHSNARKHKYIPAGGTEIEVDVEENRVPLNELKEGDEYFGGNNVIYVVEKVLDDNRIIVHQRDNKKDAKLINPEDFKNTELMWAKGGVDRIIKESKQGKESNENKGSQGEGKGNNQESKTYREKIADLGIMNIDESPVGGIVNNPKEGSSSVLTSTQQALIEKKVEKVLDKSDYTNKDLHDAIVFELNTGDRSSAPIPVLSAVYKVSDAYKEGKLTKEDVLNFVKEQFVSEVKEDSDIEDILEHNDNVTVEGDNTVIVTQSIESQAKELGSSSKEVTVSTVDSSNDADVLNIRGQQSIDKGTTYLSGMAMGEYVKEKGKGKEKVRPLEEDGILEKRKGAEPNDAMNQYFDWMNAAGIKLQNIVDHELGRILAVTPHAKVKFMVVKSARNATNDYAMKTHLMLVLDYDNNINKGITSIHNNDNGGVIESNGKKYLVVGVVGYGDRNTSKLALYDILFSNNPHSSTGYGLMRRGMGKFFKEHPEERFYVNEDISTEVVPTYPIPGWRVRQMENDTEAGTPRSILELLKEKERNPYNLKIEDLAWGIQERTQFLIVGADEKKVMTPSDPMGNLGSAFVLVSASNGKLMPAYLNVLKYQEMKDGALKNRVTQLLNDTLSPKYNKRLEAVIALSNIFYFNKGGDFILLGKNKSTISLVHNGNVFKSFTLGDSFDREEFFKAFETMNPRVNITAKVLNSIESLKEYDEAGALTSDLAMLGTAGSSYNIYGVDVEGKMIKPETPRNLPPKGSGSDFRNGDRSQVIFKHNYYREADGVFYLAGKPVTDEDTIRQLKINKRIIDNALESVDNQGVWSYYILSAGERPEVVKVNDNTKEIVEVAEDKAREIIKKEEEKKDRERREQMAQQILEEAKKGQAQETKGEGVDLEEEGQFTVDPETGELIPIAESSEEKEEGESSTKDDTEALQEGKGNTITPKEAPIVSNNLPKDTTQTFETLMKTPKYMMKVMMLVNRKWKGEAPKKPAELKEFLRGKDIKVDSIGTSEKDIEAWLKTIEDCR